MTAAAASDTITIMMDSPNIAEYNPKEAIFLWNSNGVRSKRPELAPYGMRNSINNDCDMMDTSFLSDDDIADLSVDIHEQDLDSDVVELEVTVLE